MLVGGGGPHYVRHLVRICGEHRLKIVTLIHLQLVCDTCCPT